MRAYSMFIEVTGDMASFLVMIAMFIAGNGFALMLLFPSWLTTNDASTWSPLHPTEVRKAVDTVPRAMYTSVSMMMGEFDAELMNDAYAPQLAWLLYYLYILIVNIVMLNLLIALMGGSYERVEAYSKLVTLKNRAELLLEFEKDMSSAEASSDQLHPRYLHFLVPKKQADFDAEDHEAGVVNGVRRLMTQHQKQITQINEAIFNEMQEMRSRVDQVEEDKQRVESKIDKLVTMLGAMDTQDELPDDTKRHPIGAKHPP